MTCNIILREEMAERPKRTFTSSSQDKIIVKPNPLLSLSTENTKTKTLIIQFCLRISKKIMFLSSFFDCFVISHSWTEGVTQL